MVADVRELKPDGAAKLQAYLRQSAKTALKGHGNEQYTSVPTRPPAAHVSHGVVRTSPSNPRGSSDQTGNDASNNAGAFVAEGTSAKPSVRKGDLHHMFLLLCMDTGHSTILEQLDITAMNNDQYLFDKIRNEYYRTREQEVWYQKTAVTRFLNTKSSSVSRVL